MASLGDVPEILYMDTNQISNLFSYINEGKVVEQIDRSRETTSKDAAAGISKILELQFGAKSEDEDQTEMVRKIDEVGKFAVIYSNLEDSGDIVRTSDDSVDREDLSEGDFIEGKGKVKPSPLNEIRSMMSQFAPFLDMMGSDGMEALSETSEGDMELNDIPDTQGVEFMQSFIDELANHQDIYRINGSDDFGNLIFTLNPDNFTDTASAFPNEFTEYRILGRVDHVFKEDEEEYLIELLDAVPQNTREQKTAKRKMMKGFTSGMSDALGRKVTVDEFKISYPDIRIRPMAVYLY